jgi:hypothetical protein
MQGNGSCCDADTFVGMFSLIDFSAFLVLWLCNLVIVIELDNAMVDLVAL